MNGFIFQSRRDLPLMSLVEQVTEVPYSHCGIARGNTVLESVATVRETPLDAWIAQGVDRDYALYSTGNEADDEMAFSNAKDWLGAPYDVSFDLINTQTCFCSKLLYYALQEVGYWARNPLKIRRIKEYPLAAHWNQIVTAFGEFGVRDVTAYLENFTVSPADVAGRLKLIDTSFPPKPRVHLKASPRISD